MLKLLLPMPRVTAALSIAIALAFSTAASAERLTSATIGLNYISQGHCIVVNGGDTPATGTVSIIDVATANLVAGGLTTMINPGTSITLPYQATSANRRDFFSSATSVTSPGNVMRLNAIRSRASGESGRRAKDVIASRFDGFRGNAPGGKFR